MIPAAHLSAWNRRTWAALSMLSAAYFLLNLLTFRWFPLPWVDEVMYTDPAVNFLLGVGFASSAWNSQPLSAFWAGNTPLHEWLLVPWMSAFGFSPESVRSFDSLMVVASAVTLCWGAARLGLIRSGVGIIMIAVVVYSSVGMAAIAREGRPDGIKALAVSMALLAYSVPESWRRSALFGVGLFVVPAGFQAAIFLVFACLIAWAWIGNRFLRDGVALGLGCAAGFACLLAVYWSNGVARQFLENTLASGHTLSGDLAQAVVIGDAKVSERIGSRLGALASIWGVFAIDRSHPWLIGIAVSVSGVLAWSGNLRWRSPMVAMLSLALVAPPLSLLLGKYFLHYTWIGCLPIALAVAFAVEGCEDRWRALVASAVLVVGAFGYPMQLVDRGPADVASFGALEQLASRNLGPHDYVCADHEAFYAVVQTGAAFRSSHYAGGRGLPEVPDGDRAVLTALMIKRSEVDRVVAKFGGSWKEIDSVVLDGPQGHNAEVVALFRRQ